MAKNSPPIEGNVSYSRQYRRCARAGCPSCAPPGRGHGPYWYAYWWESGRMRSRYLGKDTPAAAPVPAVVPGPQLATTTGALRVRTLGGFAVWRDRELLSPRLWRRRGMAALFKCLLGAPDHQMHREQLLELLFPNAERAVAARGLRQAVYLLRRTLDTPDAAASHLQQAGDLLFLKPAPSAEVQANWLDATAFEQAAAQALAGHDADASRVAIVLYGGEYLPEDRYEEWAERRREVLHRLHLRLLLQLAELTGEKDAEEGLRCLRTVLVTDPCHEAAALLLMRLLVRERRPSEALAVYQELVSALAADLDLQPSAAARFFAGRLHETLAAVPAERSRPAGNLPVPLTSFVGREWEQEEVRRAMLSGVGGSRLVTLVGSGGAGKTRLALEVARGIALEYPDGAWLVELGAVSDAALVPHTVARVLGLSEGSKRTVIEEIVAHLTSARLLLVLDNCEHVSAACVELAGRCLEAAPALQILATSRARLGMLGEVTWRVPSLSMPEPHQRLVLAEFAPYEAVQLFVERARASEPRFILTEANAPVVAAICRRLDGIALAIELAASKLSFLSPEQLLARLDDRFRVLSAGNSAATPRQQTLHATIGWSYALLEYPARTLLRRLSVFADGWALESAESVSAGEGLAPADVPTLLGVLVDSSMVQVVRPTGEIRYRLLESIRAFAALELESTPLQGRSEAEFARERLRSWCLNMVRASIADVRVGSRQSIWLERLDTEHDNLRAALDWSCTVKGSAGDGVLIALELAGLLGWFWDARGHLEEGRRQLARVLTRTSVAQQTPAVSRLLVPALNAAGGLAYHQADYAAATDLFERCLTLARQAEHWPAVPVLLNNLANIAHQQGEHARASTLYEEALVLKRQQQDRPGVARLLNNLGNVARDLDDYVRASVLYVESLELFRADNHSQGIVSALLNLGDLARMHEELAEAEIYYRESVVLALDLRYKEFVAGNLEGLAAIALWRRQLEQGAHLLGAATGLRESIGVPVEPSLSAALAETASELKAALGGPVFDAACNAGKLLQIDEAVREALQRW